jgi:hypothetical protein
MDGTAGGQTGQIIIGGGSPQLLLVWSPLMPVAQLSSLGAPTASVLPAMASPKVPTAVPKESLASAFEAFTKARCAQLVAVLEKRYTAFDPGQLFKPGEGLNPVAQVSSPDPTASVVPSNASHRPNCLARVLDTLGGLALT